MCMIHLASRAGVPYISTVQPKAGRSENIYYFAKYASFIHRPALGWTVKDNFFPDVKTYW